MVIFIYRSPRFLALAILPLLFCQCQTQRTVLGTRPGSVSFAGGEKTGDAKEIREKWADKGYKIGDDGAIKADNPDLYSGDGVRGVNKDFGKKEAKFKNAEARTKEFKTPEFIKRQDFRGVSEARESGNEARESNAINRAGQKLFGSKTTGADEMSAFSSERFEDSGKVFSTSPNDTGSTAIENAARATGAPMQAGYKETAAMSFDDVKQMLNPGSYARNTGLKD